MTSKPKTAYLATISNPVQIAQHPLNNSKSKNLYSFAKADRFRKSRKANCNVAFYSLNPKIIRDNRAFSMGARRRHEFAVKNDIPGPSAYFPKNKSINFEKSGFSFGKPKQRLSNKRALSQKNVTPGPGAYQILGAMDINRDKGRGFSFRIRTKQLKDDNKTVGPGLYKIPNTLNPTEKGFTSKFKSTPGFRLVPPNQTKPRIKKDDSEPAFYDDRLGMNKLGIYSYSKYKNSGVKSFGKAKRNFLDTKSIVPGPGHYQMLSDFGIYQSSKLLENK